MNKLVSRNPIQRFKQGRKIEKFQLGKNFKKVGTANNGLSGIYFNPNDSKLYKGTLTGYEYIGDSYKYTNYGIGKTGVINASDYIKKPLTGRTNTNINEEIKVLNELNPQDISTKESRVKKVGVKETGRKNNPPVSSGFIKGYQNTDDIQNVINQYGGIKGFQQFLIDNKFLSGDRSKKEGADGWWGKNTQKAYETYLQKNAPILPTSEQLIQQISQNVPVIESTPQAGTNTIQDQLSLMQQTLPATGTYIQTPTYVSADRSQTRDWMRSNGINPYSVTGAMRAAARRIRAGQANDNDRLLVKGNEQLYNLLKGYYKQGGNILPSRNIVKRFKSQRNIKS